MTANNKNDNKTVTELRPAVRSCSCKTDFGYKVLLYEDDEQEVYILVEFGRGVPVEMCRRFASDAARYFGAKLDDYTTRPTNSFEGCLLPPLPARPLSLSQIFNENQNPASDSENNAAEAE
jgi:hypothetical protein